MPRSIEIFLCYAREDEALRQGLEKHLRVLRRQGIIHLWHDRSINPGTEWEREIDNHLNTARIILLLVSPDFLDSDYCYGIEMKRAMERHERGEACIIPIILRHVYWQKTPFGKLQALPTDGKPIMSSAWYSQDEALFETAEGIRIIVEDLVNTEEAQNCVNKGIKFFEQQRYNEAIKAFEGALQYKPNFYSAYHNKGATLAVLSQYEDAIVAFDKALEIMPSEIGIYQSMISALTYLHRYEEALQLYKKALHFSPGNNELNEGMNALVEIISKTSKHQKIEQSHLITSVNSPR